MIERCLLAYHSGVTDDCFITLDISFLLENECTVECEEIIVKFNLEDARYVCIDLLDIRTI